MSNVAADDLSSRLEQAARASVLLVATDFDGTVAPIVEEPAAAEMTREAAVALRILSELPQTHVAMISGRALEDLARRAQNAGRLHLVGSHGSEFEPGVTGKLSPAAATLLDEISFELDALAAELPGAILERKPASLAFHYRNADPQQAQPILARVLSGPGARAGVQLRHGKMVVELSVVHTNKGVALDRLRQRLGATAVVFLGDDVTDEDAFATLRGPDVGVKVGEGESKAQFRIHDIAAVASTLARLAEGRSQWLAGSEAVPIEQHSILSDQRTVAIVTPAGRVTWLCLPRMDSSAVFAELLGGPSAGYFEVRSASGARPHHQRYVGDTFVLQTDWPDLTTHDYLDVSAGRAFQRPGRTDLVRVISGPGKATIEFAPRLNFGRQHTRIQAAKDGLLVEGGLEPMVLRAPGVNWTIREEGVHQTALATVSVPPEGLVLELRYGTASLAPSASGERARREATAKFWSGWTGSLTVPAVASDLVRRSALVLKALTFGPSGAIAAAATTSLPEHAGGVRNWDYRYCWPRDAAMAAAALAKLNAIGPGIKLMDWVLGLFERGTHASMLSPVYTLAGGELGPEAEITELAGYRGSRPVRVGNAASEQIQLDVCGPIADLVALLAERDAALSTEHWRLIEALVTAVEQRWREPDHGIWEVRLPRRHHVHSKVMCWFTIQRALTVAAYLGRSKPEWEALRAIIAEDVLANGWNESRGMFCSTYMGDEADASVLSIGLCGLLPASDPRFVRTVAKIEEELRVGPTVYRYRFDDGLPGVEGGFFLCASWLIRAYLATGRRAEAEAMFQQYCSLAGPTGLLTEEFDPELRLSLGNFPQAYSHLGLIDCAVELANGQ